MPQLATSTYRNQTGKIPLIRYTGRLCARVPASWRFADGGPGCSAANHRNMYARTAAACTQGIGQCAMAHCTLPNHAVYHATCVPCGMLRCNRHVGGTVMRHCPPTRNVHVGRTRGVVCHGYGVHGGPCVIDTTYPGGP